METMKKNSIQEFVKSFNEEVERILQCEDFKEILPTNDTNISIITTKQVVPLEGTAIFRVATKKNRYLVAVVLKDGYNRNVYLPNVVTHVIKHEDI